MKGSGVKIAVMIAAFALFAAGAWTLSLDPGSDRSIALGSILGAMLCLAGWVTYIRLKARK